MAVLPAKVGLGKVSPGTKETRVSQKTTPQKDAYTMILEAIDVGTFRPGDRLVRGGK